MANNQAAEKKAILGVKRFYDNVQILGGVTTKGANGRDPQIVAWQDYENSTSEVKELMKAQVDAAGQQLTHVLRTVIGMSVNGMDGQLQEQVMGSERMVNIIRAMNTSGVPGARDTALALALLQGEAANKIVALNGKYFESVARTLEDTSYGRIIKPTSDGGPVEINIEAFTNNSLLDDVDIGWDYDLDATTPGHLRNLIGAIKAGDKGFGRMSDGELLKILAAQGASVGSNSANLKLISDGRGGPKWNALNTIVGGIGIKKVEGGEDTVAGLTASQYAAVLGGVEGVSLQLAKYEKADAGRMSALNAMEGAKTLWTELTGQGFTEDGAPMVSPEEAANGTPDATATTAEQLGKGEAGEDFGTFLQQFARERGYSEEEIAKTVADINAAGGSAAYIKSQKEQNPAYFHEDVAAAIAAKPSDLWIKDEDGKIVQNPDVNVNEARETWQLGVLDALRKIDPAYTVADAKEAVAVATAVEAEEEAGTSRTPDELKVALEKGEIDQATYDAELAKITGSATPQMTADEMKLAIERGDLGPDGKPLTAADFENIQNSAVTKTSGAKETVVETPDQPLQILTQDRDANAPVSTDATVARVAPDTPVAPDATDATVAPDATVVPVAPKVPAVKEEVIPRFRVSDPDGHVHVPYSNHEVIVASLITTEAAGQSPTAWHSSNDAEGAPGTVGGVYLDRGHFGRLQFGPARLQEAQEAGVMPPDMTVQEFLKSPGTQVAVERWHFADHTKNIMKAGLHGMIGKRINGVTITMNGMLAAAHLGGFNGMKSFLNGGANAKDGNGTSLMKYLTVHGGAKAPIMTAQYPPEVMQQYLGPDHDQLDVALGNNLTSLLKDAKAAGHNVGIRSGYRSPDEQANILANNMTRRERGGFTNGERDQWLADVKKHGPTGALNISRNGRSWRQRFTSTPNGNSIRRWIGLPGGSNHQHGLAVDLNYNGSDAAEKWIHDNAEKYGLNFRMKHEPWHIELLGGAAASSGYSGATAAEARMIQDLVVSEGISYDDAMDRLVEQGLLSAEEEYAPQALLDDFGGLNDESSEVVPFMKRTKSGQEPGPDAELKDKAWRKLEESEIEELVEISEGDSGLKAQASMSLAQRYQTGRGVPKDLGKARDYYEGVVMEGGELADDAAIALQAFTSSESLQLQREEGRGTMIKGEPYILLPGGMVVRGRDGEAANEAITTLVKKRLRVIPE